MCASHSPMRSPVDRLRPRHLRHSLDGGDCESQHEFEPHGAHMDRISKPAAARRQSLLRAFVTAAGLLAAFTGVLYCTYTLGFSRGETSMLTHAGLELRSQQQHSVGISDTLLPGFGGEGLPAAFRGLPERPKPLLIDPEYDPQHHCLLRFDPISVEDVQNGALPYLFGGPQRPQCRNCAVDNNTWSQFCRYASEGKPYCGTALKRQLIDTYLVRGFHDILTITPCDLWGYIRGRTIWVAGDSQSLDFMKALFCFLVEFWDVRTGYRELAEEAPNLAPLLQQLRLSQCVVLPLHTRICYLRADTFTTLMGTAVPVAQMLGTPNDIMVANVGLHHHTTYKEDAQAMADFFKANAATLPYLIWANTAPQHFDTVFGEYPRDGGTPPFVCKPIGPNAKLMLLNNHELQANDPEYAPIAAGGWRNAITTPIFESAGVPVLHTWNETLGLWQFHRDNGAGLECTHYCHPSAPQLWAYYLYETLRTHVAEMNAHFAQGTRHESTGVHPLQRRQRRRLKRR